jgi:oxygen-independent coproporphyrinogen-3 oxidase
LEANPSSSEAGKFTAFRAAGINRLSLGVQSFDDASLRFLGRAHDAQEARTAIELAARTFPRFSFDLIYARQGQDLAAWKAELAVALGLAGGHLSLYQLTIEPHTQFAVRAKRGEFLTAPDEAAAAMYEETQDIMDRAGLPAYEISNHARRGEESRHNLTYWHYEDYIGVGPGAHGRYSEDNARLATEAIRAPDLWLQQVARDGHGVKIRDPLDHATQMEEAAMMGLRLADGISFAAWRAKFGAPLLSFLDEAKTARLEQEGLMARDETGLRATRAGLQRLNAILNYLL